MKTKTIQLRQHLNCKGQEISELTVRRINIGDEEDAMQQAVSLKRSKNPITVEMCIFAKAARIPYDAVRQMNSVDYAALRQAMDEVNGGLTEIEEEDEENPMTPKKDSASFAGQSSPSEDTAAGS